jgi:hypothetical protein
VAAGVAENANDKTRQGWPGRELLARRADVSLHRASQLATELVAEGVLKQVGGGGRHRGPARYELLPLAAEGNSQGAASLHPENRSQGAAGLPPDKRSQVAAKRRPDNSSQGAATLPPENSVRWQYSGSQVATPDAATSENVLATPQNPHIDDAPAGEHGPVADGPGSQREEHDHGQGAGPGELDEDAPATGDVQTRAEGRHGPGSGARTNGGRGPDSGPPGSQEPGRQTWDRGELDPDATELRKCIARGCMTLVDAADLTCSKHPLCFVPGCEDPARRGCSTCWAHASEEPAEPADDEPDEPDGLDGAGFPF